MIDYKYKKELYPKVALLKAAYNYTDKSYLHLDADENYYYVSLEMKEGYDPIAEKDFENEMLAQTVRHEVYLQTKNIRELLLARAMATTIVTDSKKEPDTNLFEDKYNESEILKDWFEHRDT